MSSLNVLNHSTDDHLFDKWQVGIWLLVFSDTSMWALWSAKYITSRNLHLMCYDCINAHIIPSQQVLTVTQMWLLLLWLNFHDATYVLHRNNCMGVERQHLLLSHASKKTFCVTRTPNWHAISLRIMRLNRKTDNTECQIITFETSYSVKQVMENKLVHKTIQWDVITI